MARYRIIKPEFWEDDKIAECSPSARLLFVALWNFADDEGFLEYRLKWLKAKCLPYDDVDMAELLVELEKAGRVIIQGEIIWIKNFLKHQKIDRPTPSVLSQKFKDSANIRRVVDESSTLARVQEVKLKQVKLSKDKLKGEEEKTDGSTSDPTPAQKAEEFFLFIRNKTDRYELFVENLATRYKLSTQKVSAELDKFANYWTEKSRDGKKEKWQVEKFFECDRRLQTWFSRIGNFRDNESPKVAIIR